MIDVLLRGFAECDNIVELNEGGLTFNAGQEHVHGTLERTGFVTESEWHTYEAIQIMM